MLIKSVKIRNFKSFGNDENTITLNTDTGELILLQGPNGGGKSSVLESFDFSFYGKVRGKKKKYLTNDTLPNRYNKNLSNTIEFRTDAHDITINRCLSPSKLELYIDNERYDRAGKANVQSKIEEIIGIDIDTFKSFISMSVNDFKNFMVLTPDEKRMLLDRLFNLEMINDVSKIIKEKKKQNAHEVALFNTEIQSYENSLSEFRRSVDKIRESAKKNVNSEYEGIRNIIVEKRPMLLKFKERVETGIEKERLLRERITEVGKQSNETGFKVEDYLKRIRLYESGVCPTCENDLTDDTKVAYKEDMKRVVSELRELKSTLDAEHETLIDKQRKLTPLVREAQEQFTELNLTLRQHKTNLDALKESMERQDESQSVSELLESIDKIAERKETSVSNYNRAKDKNNIIEQLNRLFSEEGIKKSIISKIVVPINKFIEHNLTKLDVPFKVRLDDQFTANVSLLGQDIEVDSLSSGETRLVNLAVMLAYLKLIRMKKHINMLFLDEVFSTVDVQNIYLILDLLKDFAREFNVNVFVIHHAMLEKNYFDKVYSIKKDITSKIVAEDMNDSTSA
jgi:DNA repair exonuclease SbcCD ATPase subunit